MIPIHEVETMTQHLQVVCPECNTVNPTGYAYCFRCGTSLEGALAVELLHPTQEPTYHSGEAAEPLSFFAWWFRPSVTLVFRWPIAILYPIAGAVVVFWTATLIISAFPFDPLTCGIGTVIGLPILVAPGLSFFWTLPRIYAVWTDSDIQGYGSRILMTLGFLVLPIILYVVVIYLIGFAVQSVARPGP
jgi:hypothetical protein